MKLFDQSEEERSHHIPQEQSKNTAQNLEE
jgi:hypothetical protein